MLQADLRAGRIAIADVAGRAAALAAVALVAALDLGFYAVVVSAGVGAAVTLASPRRWRGRWLPRARPPTARLARRLLLAALPLGAALALNEAYFRADALIISLVAPVRGARAATRWPGGWASSRRRSRRRSSSPCSRCWRATSPRATRGWATALQAAGDVSSARARRSRSAARWSRRSSSARCGGESFAGAATPLRILLVAAAIGFVNGLSATR